MVGWHHQLEGQEFEQAPGVDDREAWHAEIHGVTKSWTQVSKWTELKVKQKPWDIFIPRHGMD